MDVMLKLKLPPEKQNFNMVQKLRGLSDLNMDEHFGLVCINPKQELFVVRVREIERLTERKEQCPELLEAFGELRIETT